MFLLTRMFWLLSLPIFLVNRFAKAQTIPAGFELTITLPPDGLVTDALLLGFPGTTLHTIRYEPICGTLGTSNDESLYSQPFDSGARCTQALAAYVKSPDTSAMYDQSGVKLPPGAHVCRRALCSCFSLTDVRGGITADMCLYFNSQGKCERKWELRPEVPMTPMMEYVAVAYQPGSKKALLPCSDVDLEEAVEEWSATAVDLTAAVTRTQRTSSAQTLVSKSASIDLWGVTHIVDHTYTRPAETGSAGGRNVTDSEIEDTGLSTSDKIAIGMGLGLGIPTLILSIVMAVRKKREQVSS